MAQTKKSVNEFIQDAFCPMVAVLCSYDAESICRKNNLTFAELIQPFCRLPSEVNYRDPSNNLIVLKNFRVDIKDFNSLPPQNTLAKKLLNETVGNALTTGVPTNERPVNTDQYQLRIRATTPWFDAWRDCFLRIGHGGDHELLKNYLACVMVVSTSHLDPMDAFAKLVQQQVLQQQQSPTKLPKWFMTNIYKYFVLLHDVTEGEESRAVSIFSDLKQQYGAGNCHLLQINSKRAGQLNSEIDTTTNMPDPWRLYVKQATASSSLSQNPLTVREVSITDSLSTLMESTNQESVPDISISHPLSSSEISNSDLNSLNMDEGYDGSSVGTTSSMIHGGCLTLSDHDRIHVFMSEFVTKGLLPWVETNLKTLHDQITSRRGLTKIFSMPKKLFGGNTSTSKSQHSLSSGTQLNNESTEILLRRAADLAFLFQNYEFAYNFYYAAKRDFSREQNPPFYAGLLEMCCLSNFMQESSASKNYPTQYMDEAIDIYTVVAKLPIFATRAVLMSTEILKSKELYDQAVPQFLKLSQEDSDLRSALFLEQASHCYLNFRPPFIRKYAFYMVIAGHRFLKAGQRLHALRCYNDVLNIYGQPNWSLALDHINFTLAKQSALLNHCNDAMASFNALFAPNNRMQSDQQQINFFKEYLNVFNKLTADRTTLPELPVPIVENTTIKVLLAGVQSPRYAGYVSNCNDFDFDETQEVWSDLERTLTIHDRRTSGTRTQPILFTSKTQNQQNPIAVANEVVRLEFYLRNTLQIALLLSEVQLLWKYSSKDTRRKTSVTSEHTEETIECTNDMLTKQIDPPVECESITDCVIFANDTLKVELSCRPRRAGFVTILGISYRLNILVQNISDQINWPYGVMGKTLFQVKGARLNSDRRERLNVVYARDRRLELQVVPETPLLQIEYSLMPAAMFCGEIQSCLLNLINTSSTHAINRVRLATSQPSFIAVSSSDDDRLLKTSDQQEMHWNPSFHPHLSTLQLVSPHHPLAPNSTRTVRLWLRASQIAGEMNIDFLFLYDSDQCPSPLRHRTVKHSALIVVTHSLALHTESQSTGLGQMFLPVQIENTIATAHSLKIEIEQISCVSKQWTVENLSSSIKNSIRNGENLSFLFKCFERAHPHEILYIKHMPLSKELVLKKNYTNITEHPIGDFFRHFISHADSSVSSHRQKNSTPVVVPSMTLVLLWKIMLIQQSQETEMRYGLHLFSPKIDIPVEHDEQKTDSIQYELIYPLIVEHKFTRMFHLPVELKLHNRTKETVQVQLQLSRSTLNTERPVPSFCLWCGMTEQYLQLSASAILSVPLRACFFKPGFYSLGNITLTHVDASKSTSIPIKSNNHEYFVDIRASA